MLTIKKPKAPQGLGPSKKLWQEITDSYEPFDAHQLELLKLACLTLDRVTEARAVLKKEGAYIVDRYGQPREHPAAVTERQNKILFMRLSRELGLDLGPPDEKTRGKRRY